MLRKKSQGIVKQIKEEKMTNRDRERTIQGYMNEYGMSREEAERHFDIMESAYESWCNPCEDDGEKRWSATCPWNAPGMRISDFL